MGRKSLAHVHKCSLSSAKTIVYSPETQTARRSAIITRIAMEVRDSRPIPEKIWVATLPPSSRPLIPSHGFMWWTCCPVYFKNYEIWLKGDRCVNLPVLFLAVFGPNCMVWALRSPSPPSVIIPPHFPANKATWKSVSHLLHIFSHDATWGMKEMEIFPRRKLPSRWRLCTKYHTFFFLSFCARILKPKCNPQQTRATES